MKRVFSIIGLIFIFYGQSNAQVNNKYQYEAKIKSLNGKLEIKFWSEGIIEFGLQVLDESGSSIYTQKGFALSPNIDELKKNGMDFGEQIGPDGFNPITARPYDSKCKCEKWLCIKVAKDLSVIQVDCGQDLLNQLSGNNSDQNKNTQILAVFYLKK